MTTPLSRSGLEKLTQIYICSTYNTSQGNVQKKIIIKSINSLLQKRSTVKKKHYVALCTLLVLPDKSLLADKVYILP